MSWDQIAGLLRQILPFVGGFAISRGWLNAEQLTTVIGGVIGIGGVAWSLWANSKTSLVKSVGAMAETQVSPGGATITIKDPALAKAAADAQK